MTVAKVAAEEMAGIVAMAVGKEGKCSEILQNGPNNLYNGCNSIMFKFSSQLEFNLIQIKRKLQCSGKGQVAVSGK